MYAVIRTGNKQYRVEPGVELLVEKLEGLEAGQALEIKDVLAVADGDNIQVGQPNIDVSVHCICIAQEKGPKLRTVKYARRKNYRRTYGHRQQLTRLRVDRIETRAN